MYSYEMFFDGIFSKMFYKPSFWLLKDGQKIYRLQGWHGYYVRNMVAILNSQIAK